MTVRAQVDGKLLSVNFKEGQDVKKGDVLAKIDPVTYKAQLDQATAKKALDEALPRQFSGATSSATRRSARSRSRSSRSIPSAR